MIYSIKMNTERMDGHLDKAPKILILTGSYGNGHLEVTRALIEELHRVGIKDITTSDLFYEAHPIVTTVTKYLYIKSFTRYRNLYGFLYYNFDNQLKEHSFDKFTDSYGYIRLNQLMKNNDFDLVINTFPMQVFPAYKKKVGKRIPFVNVLTDFCLHTRWVSKEIDHFFVSCDHLKTELIESGIPKETITISGIPIKEQFYLENQEKAQKMTSPSSKKNLLISAGAYGVLTNLADILEELQSKEDLNIVVVCGNNKNLFDSLSTQFADQPTIEIKGFVSEMAKLMSHADIMITKPGGISLSEALAIQTPLILTPGVPGQESENAQLFEKECMAIVTKTEEEIIPAIYQLLKQPLLAKNLVQHMEEHFYPHAAKTIITDSLALAGISIN